MTPSARAYDELAAVDVCVHGDRHARMAAAADALWAKLSLAGVSWIGFYLFEQGCIPREHGQSLGGSDGLVLGPCRDKPACSPIGLSGACGRSYLSRRSLVVTDVARLGANYIACDPRDRSEVVVPCFDADGSCWGVLDADSFDAESFTTRDAEELARLLERWGLSANSSVEIDVV